MPRGGRSALPHVLFILSYSLVPTVEGNIISLKKWMGRFVEIAIEIGR
jgi:hypothetical protein